MRVFHVTGPGELELREQESPSPGPGELVREGIDADGIAHRLLAGLGTRDRHQQTPRFHCGCDRERVLRAVGLLEREELLASVRGGEALEVRCRSWPSPRPSCGSDAIATRGS